MHPLDRRLTAAEWSALRWSAVGTVPYLAPSLLAPAVRDPAVLSLQDGPDGRWHLWADSVLGIDHYTSPDGLRWAREDLVAPHALGAHVRRTDRGFVMLYTRGPLAVAARGALPFPAPCELAMRTSDDLVAWSPATPALTATLPWFESLGGGVWLSHPCLVQDGQRWRLYFSAGTTATDAPGETVARYVGLAETDDLSLGFVPHPQPVLQPQADAPEAARGAGSLKVFARADGGWAGVQAVYGVDGAGAPTASLRCVQSDDGVQWTPDGEAILTLGGDGWARYDFGAFDLAVGADHVHLYFSARDEGRGWGAAGAQVGRISARLP